MSLRLRTVSQSLRCQRGSGIMMAVFIILFFTAMAAAIVKVQTTAGDAIVVEVYSARALNAANSGAGRVLEDVITNLTTNCSTTTTTVNLTFSNSGLENCGAVVECTNFTNSGIRIYRIQSTGSCEFDQGPRITSRTVIIEAKDL